MTRDDIIELALQCGIWIPIARGPERALTIHKLCRLATLVAAAERDALRAALQHEADCVEAAKAEIKALRAKVAEMEKQEPLDAGSDVFRSAFEAALKAGNWPATRQGDGYRSPSTQIAWRIAFSTVNRLKLYALPGAQPAPSVPTGWKLVPIDPTRNMLDIMDLGSNMLYRYRALLAAAPEAKP